MTGARVEYFKLSRPARKEVREGYLQEFNLQEIRQFYRDINNASDIAAKRLFWLAEKFGVPPKQLI
jgi:hypothetical protein